MSHKGEGEENRLVLLMLGRDDLLFVACLNSCAVLSDNDVPIWRTHESLRVRYSSIGTRPRRWSFSVMPCLTIQVGPWHPDSVLSALCPSRSARPGGAVPRMI